MMTVGKTRYSNSIWMEFSTAKQFVKTPKFDNSEENFDGLAAFQALYSREKILRPRSHFQAAYEEAIRQYDDRLKASDLEELGLAVGIKSSSGRIAYGFTLLNPEFQF